MKSSEDQTLRSIHVKQIRHDLAVQFFKAYEHLGNCGLGVWHWGAFLNETLIGAVSIGTTCFGTGRGLLPSIAMQFDLPIYQICRGGTATGVPFNTPSRVLSLALSAFHQWRGNCLVVAYADRAYNEVGTIYQACNGLYTGQTNPKDQANYMIKGRLMSGWVVRKKFGTRSMHRLRQIDRKALKLPLSPKYRYVFVQASGRQRNDVLEALRPYVLPYPNRQTEKIPSMNIADLVVKRGIEERPRT